MKGDTSPSILGDPGAESGGKGKSKRAEKYSTEKSKERREEPLGTMSYQTSSKWSPPFWLLIRQKNTKVFWHQSAARTAVTFWNWSGETLSSGTLLTILYFSSCHIFRLFRLSLTPTICPWVSEDEARVASHADFMGESSLTEQERVIGSPKNVLCGRLEHETKVEKERETVH